MKNHKPILYLKNSLKPINVFIGVFLLFVLFSCVTEELKEAPHGLTVSEGFSDPLGFYDANPTFSWKLPVNDQVKSQSAYELVVASNAEMLPNESDLWKSGKVESDQSVWVNYKGKELQSRQKVYWQVKFYDQDGKSSAWSKTASFELGLLNNSDWQAKWISAPASESVNVPDSKQKAHKVQYLRNDFTIDSEVLEARLYITAKGLFEAKINGQKVGNDLLAPGWTSYDHFIEVLTYDVTGMIRSGENALGLSLAEGWYAGRFIFRGYPLVEPKVMCQLEVKYANGDELTFVTDENWKFIQNGPIVYSGIYDGEKFDARMNLDGWAKTGYDDQAWQAVATEEIDPSVKLTPKRHNTIKETEELTPVSLAEIDKGSVIFDLGQNMVGVPRIKVPMKKDGTLKIRFAEMLQKDGRIYTKNYRSAVSTNIYTAKEDGIAEWQPTFTFQGFRYVELSGFDPEATPDKSWITGVVCHSNFDLNVTFESSHEKLNQLQSNIIWGIRGNTLDIPTDCPQRDERAGWTGDAQVIAPTSFYIADMHSFWMSWLQSARFDQYENGGIPIVVPDLDRERVSSGWGDIATVIPWETYIRTGDIGALEENYNMMKKWVGFYGDNASNHIVDIFTYGDWLQPYSNRKDSRFGETNEKLINTAYYARSIELTVLAANELGYTDEAKKLQLLHDSVCEAFQSTFFSDEGRVSVGKETQTAYLMALGFGLLDDELSKKAIPHLLEQIELADNHLRTGFLGTPLLSAVLDEIGKTDLMYEILFKETYPSWFYSINQGATTMWERWDSYTHKDGFNKGGMNSFNHYAYGAIGQWMYERIAGIKPLKPGFKEIEIAPLPGGPLTSAEVSYNTPYGLVSSAWKIENGVFKLKAMVPPNTTAKIVIPANTAESLLLNGSVYSDNVEVKLLKKNKGDFELEAGAGTYVFESKLN